MSNLTEYQQKRNFGKTAEPAGGKATKSKQLRFVIQHHVASRDHYDLRLEWEGAMKSWAVPKGPSRNPADKRLAMMVEDHPLEYRHFEGTIPKGEYGGGTVMLWDEGDYEPLEFGDSSIKFILYGSRLKGKWALVRIKDQKDNKKENSWLLMKEKDSESKDTAGISQFKTSVRTGRTMEEIEAGKSKKAANNPFEWAEIQLAKLMGAVPENGGWVYELKYDGYRIISYVEAGGARLLTRNGNDYAKQFAPAKQALLQLAGGRAMVLDGEMVVMTDGRPDFQAMQNYIKNPANKQLRYMIFDILALDGEDLRVKPLAERKEILEDLLADAPEELRYSAHIEGNGEELLRKACGAQLEGVIGKRADSPYSGTRSGDWIKLKCNPRQEFVIGGYTRSSKRSSGVSSLLLGVYDGGALVYCGRAGGFSEKGMRELEEKFGPVMQKTPPFIEAPKARAGETVAWLKPALSAEVAFVEWTKDGLLRQAKLKGLRLDKTGEDVRRIKKEDMALPQGSGCVIAGVAISNPDKVVSQDVGLTKEGLARYYETVAGRMLPHIRGRLISAVRCPGGADKPCFFKKHPGNDTQGIVPVALVKSGGEPNSYYYVNDVFGLVSEVQMNTVEFHVWGSRADALEAPDVMVFDLDPDEGMNLEDVRQGVRDLKQILNGLGLKSYLKTSGGKGYHVVIPFRPAMEWEAFRDTAKGIVGIMETKWPDRYTGNSRKANRKGKIFVDWLRNTRGATSAAPYSVRMRPGMPVSMPIAWSELSKIAPGGISMEEAVKRMKRKDPWEGFFI